eukprot:5754482-Pyramimonas_sp.AAC.1
MFIPFLILRSRSKRRPDRRSRQAMSNIACANLFMAYLPKLRAAAKAPTFRKPPSRTVGRAPGTSIT